MPRKAPITEDQQSLFLGELSSPSSPIFSWAETQDNPNLQAYLEAKAEGVPMVDVLDRAIRIKEALTEMGRMSSVGVGFLTAVHTHHVERIDKSYGRFGTPIVERNARNKLPRREQRVKNLLAPASGYAALRTASPELMPREEIDALAKHTWGRFNSRFTGPDNDERRQKYKRNLSKQITAQKRLRKKLGLPIPQYVDKIKV
jgi:hypothetical protein